MSIWYNFLTVSSHLSSFGGKSLPSYAKMCIRSMSARGTFNTWRVSSFQIACTSGHVRTFAVKKGLTGQGLKVLCLTRCDLFSL